jgi:hypothetical protein
MTAKAADAVRLTCLSWRVTLVLAHEFGGTSMHGHTGGHVGGGHVPPHHEQHQVHHPAAHSRAEWNGPVPLSDVQRRRNLVGMGIRSPRVAVAVGIMLAVVILLVLFL